MGNSLHPPPYGEIQDGYSRRLARFELQREARRLLRDHKGLSGCLRYPVPGANPDGYSAAVYQRAETRSTYYGGLKTCGGIWVCPVCAQKISERRRAELAGAVDRHRENGGEVLLLTLTVPHHRGSVPFELVDKLLEIVRRLNSGKRALAALVPGYVGQVRALEVTWSEENGWHPHVHVLIFVRAAVDLLDLWGPVWLRWAALVEGSGLGRPSPRAFDLRDGSYASQYASKWGIADEITKQTVKVARRGGRTPFALLADAAGGDDQAGSLFREFARAFRGKRQLRWSAGLRDHLGLTIEKTDEEEAAAVDATDDLLGRITDEDWTLIVNRNLRGVVLEVLRDGSWSDLDNVLTTARMTRETENGTARTNTSSRRAARMAPRREKTDGRGDGFAYGERIVCYEQRSRKPTVDAQAGTSAADT